MSETIGKVSIDGTPAQIGLVKAALAKCSPPVENLPTKAVKVKFGTPANVPGSGKPAWGFTSGRTITLNAAMAARKPYRISYTLVHELAHILDKDYLNPTKRNELSALMLPKPTLWAHGNYAKRGCEAFADAFAESVGFTSPLDTFYADIADSDLPKVLTILLRAEPAAEPPPDPVALPLPDPCVSLKTAISTAFNALDAVYPFSEP